MENDQNQQQTPPTPEAQPEVTFPAGEEKKSRKFPKWILAVIGVLIIVGGGVWFLLQTPGTDEIADNEPTPVGNTLSAFATPDPTDAPEPTEAPEPEDKSKLVVEVLNGTGIPGEASFLQAKLEDLGFEDIEAANADDQDETLTTVTFDRKLSPALVDEIKEFLEEIYSGVKVKKASLTSTDIRITTGPRGNATKATPKTTAAPTSTSSGENE